MAPKTRNLPFFLSYSRKDYDLVMSIKAEIESLTGKLCWMDTEGIESGNPAFDEAIVRGINECRVFLFMLSANSQKSEFAINELEFARKKARDEGKKVVMVNIDGCSLSDTFFFRYSRVDTIYWQDPIQKRKLFANLKTWLLEDDDDNSDLLPPKEVRRTYAIGDVLTFGNQSGVVFYLDSSREHGKIVSMDSAVKKWCTTKEYMRHRDTGAVSDDNGMDNLRQIQQIPDWENSYPAFKWCANKGEGWYLPTIEELHLIAKRRKVIAEKMGEIEEQRWYWSSEQESVYCARYYHFLSGQAGCQVGKDLECMVLAVREF